MAAPLSRTMRATRAVLGGALDWDSGDPVDPAAMAVTALGMGAPILLGVLIGRPTIGLAASVGSMWVGNAPRGVSFGEHRRILRDVVLAALAAAIVAAVIAQRGWWSDLWLVLAAGIAALTGGFSRPMAAASQRFVVFATIALGVASHAHDRTALAIVIGEGAIWTAACALAIGVAARRWRIGRVEPVEAGASAPFAAKFRRWRGTLRTFAGWDYPARLVFCLGAAAAIGEAFPQHHYSWIAVAVALLTQRQESGLVVRVTRRALGVAAGVVATELIATRSLPGWALVVVIAGLAAAGPYLRRRSYVAHTAATTPLIMLLTSGGAIVGQGLLLDRLSATLIAAALAIGTCLATARIRPRPAPGNPRPA